MAQGKFRDGANVAFDINPDTLDVTVDLPPHAWTPLAAKVAAGVKGYASEAAALAATDVGEQFWIDAGDGVADLYVHEVGDVAQPTGETALIEPGAPGASRGIGMRKGGTLDDALRFVTAEQIGAYGYQNGGTGDDDTGVFQDALSVPGTVILLDPYTTYDVGELVPAFGSSIRSHAGRGYSSLPSTTTPNAANRGRLMMLTGASCLLDVSAAIGFSAEGVVLDGNDASAPVVTGGSYRTNLTDVHILNGLRGIGGSSTGAELYSHEMDCRRVLVTDCEHGIKNVIDSDMDVIVAQCDINIYLQAGANSNRWTGRAEWSLAGPLLLMNGTALAPVAANNFSGFQFDRGYYGQVKAQYCARINFMGGWMHRGNASGDTNANYNNLVFIENCERLSFMGVDYSRFGDDAGGTVTPDYAFYFNGTNNRIDIIGGSLPSSGFTAFLRNYAAVTELDVRVPGVADIRQTTTARQVNGKSSFRDKGAGTPMAAAGGTSTVTLNTGVSLNTFDTRQFQVEVTARNSATGADYSAAFEVLVQREGGSATTSIKRRVQVDSSLADYAAPAISNPPTQAEVTAIGAELSTVVGIMRGKSGIGLASDCVVQVALGTVATDGLTFDLTFTNRHATNVIQVIRVDVF